MTEFSQRTAQPEVAHFERNIKFCYKCAAQMEELDPEHFRCNCGVEYKTDSLWRRSLGLDDQSKGGRSIDFDDGLSF